MIVMNYLANALPLNNHSTGELSDQYPNLFVPAGITFSIWGILYILLGLYCIMQFKGNYQDRIQKTEPFFALSCILNTLWILCWHYEKPLLSLLVMALLLVTLIILNLQIKQLQTGIIKAIFGLYLGWICVATIANTTAVLVYLNWSGFGISEEIWTIIMILVATIITGLSVRKLSNPYIGVAVIWAFIGIVLKRSHDYISIVMVALFAITIILVVTIHRYFYGKHKVKA